MYDHYPSLRGCVRDCCRRFIERWRKSASYRSEPAEEKSGKKHLLSLSLFFFYSLFLSFNLSASIFLFQHLFSLLHCAYLHIPRTNLPFFLRIVYFCLDRANWFQAIHAFLRRRLCVHEYSLFLFYFFPAAVSFTYLLYLHTSLRLCFLLFVFLSLLLPSLRRPFSLSFSISICLSLRLSLSFLAVNCVYLPTRVSQYFLVRESETNDGPQATIKILMFYFFLFYRLSQSTKLHPRVLITSIAKTQRGKFSRVSSLLACTPTWCMP